MIGTYRVVLSLLILLTAIAAQAEMSAKDAVLAKCNLDCTVALQNQLAAAAQSARDNAFSTKSVYATDPKVAAASSTSGQNSANCTALQGYAAQLSVSGSAELQASVQKAVDEACGGSAGAADQASASLDPQVCVPKCFSETLAKLGVKEPAPNESGAGSTAALLLQLQQSQGGNGQSGNPLDFLAGLPAPDLGQ